MYPSLHKLGNFKSDYFTEALHHITWGKIQRCRGGRNFECAENSTDKARQYTDWGICPSLNVPSKFCSPSPPLLCSTTILDFAEGLWNDKNGHGARCSRRFQPFCSHENSIERLLIGKLIKFRTKTARKSAQSGLPSKCGRRAGTNVDADAGLLSSPVCPLLTDNGLLGVWAALSSSEPSTSNAPLSGAV